MAGIVVSDGRAAFLAAVIAPTGFFTILPYSNDFTPDVSTTAGDLTGILWGGGAQVCSGWSIPASIDGGVTYRTQAFVATWTNSSGSDQVVYGYGLQRASDGVLMAAERFAGPGITVADGTTLSIVPKLNDIGV